MGSGLGVSAWPLVKPSPGAGQLLGGDSILGSLHIPFPGSFPLRSGPWRPCLLLSMGTGSWALTFRCCPQHRDVSQTHLAVQSHLQSRMSSPTCPPLSPHRQNLDPSSSSPVQTSMVFTWGLLEEGPVVSHPCTPQELTQRTLRYKRPPHPDQELLCQDDSQPENFSKCHVGLSSCSSCFSYSFVVNGLVGK